MLHSCRTAENLAAALKVQRRPLSVGAAVTYDALVEKVPWWGGVRLKLCWWAGKATTRGQTQNCTSLLCSSVAHDMADSIHAWQQETGA
jgi:hypothetical protein